MRDSISQPIFELFRPFIDFPYYDMANLTVGIVDYLLFYCTFIGTPMLDLVCVS